MASRDTKNNSIQSIVEREFPFDHLCVVEYGCILFISSPSFGRLPICVSMERGGSKGIFISL